MEYIGKRISWKRNENGLSIVVLSTADKTKKLLLFLWFFLWSLCGVIVITQYFRITDPNTRVAIIVWIGFWAYFEFRIFKAYMWRSGGLEKIKIRDGKLLYKRDTAGRGKIQSFEKDFVKDLRVLENGSSFMDQLNSSYWVIAGERIAFDYYGKEVKLGLQLDDSDSAALYKLISKELKS